jgi:hypothetical protein
MKIKASSGNGRHRKNFGDDLRERVTDLSLHADTVDQKEILAVIYNCLSGNWGQAGADRLCMSLGAIKADYKKSLAANQTNGSRPC